MDSCNLWRKIYPKFWPLLTVLVFQGFHLTVSPDAMLALATHAKKENKIFAMNLSAPFLSKFFKEPLMKLMPYCDYIFGNETVSLCCIRLHLSRSSVTAQSDCMPQIYKGDPRPGIPHLPPPLPPPPTCNGIISHGAQIGGIWVFADHTCKNKHKTNASTIFGYVYLHAQNRNRCRWHTHLTNHGYFDYGKKMSTPIWAPCRDQNGAGFGISLVYLCCMPKLNPTLRMYVT